MSSETPAISPRHTQPESSHSSSPIKHEAQMTLPSPHQSSTLARSEGPSLASPPQDLNGSQANPLRAPASSRLPKRRGWSNERKLWAGIGAALVVLVLVLVGIWVKNIFGKAPFNGPTWTVRKEKLKVAIVERGSL